MKTLAIILAILAIGCTNNKVSFDTAEEGRRIVRDNVAFLAQKFRADNKLGDLDLMVRGDSTISMNCPQGDGWASVDLIDRTLNKTYKLKCSTVSAGIGCMTESDFKGKVYAQEEGVCNRDIPFPLPKITK